MVEDTIFSLATPAGISGVAVIRISGETTLSVLENLIENVPAPRYASLKNVRDPATKRLLDQALVLWFPSPHSYTGENMAELHIHGSIAVIRALSDVLSHLNCRPAEAGEFSRRALHNGKIDLVDAESLDSLIHAKDRASLDLAHGQSSQKRQDTFNRWKHTLIELQASVEALIDFPDDDLPVSLKEKNRQDLQDLSQEVRNLVARSTLAMTLDTGLEILIVGSPNAGKSTFLNALAGYERAIVSPEAGTTRDFVELDFMLGPFQVRFVDTAGLRDAQSSLENLGIKRTLERFSSATLILNLHDATQNALKIDAPCEVWDIQTKGLVSGMRSISAEDSEQNGVETLMRDVERWLKNKYQPVLSQVSFHRERQVFHVKRMLSSLEQAQKPNILAELQAENLRQAAQELAYLSGAIHVEDVLDTLFSGFCIGK